MRKLFSLPSILPKRLGLPGRATVAANLSQRLGGVATSETDKLLAEMGTGLAVPLPPHYWLFQFLTIVCYMALTQAVKSWLLKEAWA